MTATPADLLQYSQFKRPPMTLTEANQIWFDCYQSTDLTLWDRYTTDQRLEAIQTRDRHANGGQWGVWNISDRD